VAERLWADARGASGWDVGANAGQSVEIMVSRFSLVCAFEPAAESYAELDRLWSNFGGVLLFNLAVSDRDGQIDLIESGPDLAKGQLVTCVPAAESASARRVPSRTLDSLMDELGAPDFVKVDTEGHEALVLQGAGRLLAVRAPRFLVEFHSPDLHDDCVSILEDAGYEVETVRHPHYAAESPLWYQHGWLRAWRDGA